MADVIDSVTKRIATSTSSTATYLDRLQAKFDPLGAAITRASSTLSKLSDIASLGGNDALKATNLIGSATENLSAALVKQSSAQDAVAASTKASGFVLRDAGIQLEQFVS